MQLEHRFSVSYIRGVSVQLKRRRGENYQTIINNRDNDCKKDGSLLPTWKDVNYLWDSEMIENSNGISMG